MGWCGPNLHTTDYRSSASPLRSVFNATICACPVSHERSEAPGPLNTPPLLMPETSCHHLPSMAARPPLIIVVGRIATFVILALLAISLSASVTLLEAQMVDVIRGRVTGENNEPLSNVTITVTMISGNVNRSGLSDANGMFTVTFPNGDGDYMVSVAAVGYSQKRFEIKRVADEDVLLADTKLTRVGAVLDAMTVTADRQRVSRSEVQSDISGTEQAIPQNNAQLPPEQMGDLAAMAATLPGVQLVPGMDGAGGYSVLGLSADQNNALLNGMNFGGSTLPRDAAVMSSLMTSPYDVSRGGFSGAQFNLRTRGGTNFVTRGLSFVGQTPSLQWMDASARATGQEYNNGSLGAAFSGPLVFDKAFYNTALQLGRRSSDLQTLLNTSPTGLKANGVAADSVKRLSGILGSAQVPLSTNLPGSNLSDQGSILGAIDFTPPTSTSGASYNLTLNGFWNRQNPATGLGTSLPTASAERNSLNGGLQGRHSAYLSLDGIDFLTETSVGFSASKSSATPAMQLPGGKVRVKSVFDDRSNGIQTLTFGGNQTLSTSQSSSSLMANNTLSWFSANNKHRLKLATELRHDGSRLSQTSNQLGTFTYNSLADLESGLPSLFTRTLAPGSRSVGQMVGAVSLGDSWRRTERLQIQYGVRVDGNNFLNAPMYNPLVESRFGTRNDYIPGGLYPSARLGFSWQYGTGPQVGAFQGAFRGPRAVVRGGIGMFQSLPQPTQVGSAMDNTGLGSGLQQLACVGGAVPSADWLAYSANPGSIPRQCADGSMGTVFANSSPNVTMFSRSYKPPLSLRSNLNWTGAILGNRLNATLDATWSLNRQQSGFTDLNFAGVQQFTLGNEASRPVYVNPGSIVPLTGALALGDSRLFQDFQRVTQLGSDLASESRQLSLRISPVAFNTKLSWSASYTYGQVREQYHGFQNTAGDPAAINWSRSSFDSRHQIIYSVFWNAFDFVRISWGGQFRSGTPFTPMIAGDVNGDGYVNDRAFVFDPDKARDPALALDMRSLLKSGSAVARRCLNGQMDHLAGRNSCEGPWTSTANLSFAFNPLKVRLPQRATLSFNISNPLGAADLLLNGEKNLRGWGQQVFPDPSLLYVRGFNPATQEFRYVVNERFAATNPQFQTMRSPVVISASLRYDIGPTRERQLLTQTLDRGRRTEGTKASEALIKLQFGSGGVPNPIMSILRTQDTLKLSSDQADSLANLNRRYTVRLDSIWAPIAKAYAELPDDYRRDRVYMQFVKAREASIDMLRGYAPHVLKLLTPAQRRQLPAYVTSALDDRYLKSIRSGTAGDGMAAFTGGNLTGISGMAAGSSSVIIMR